MVRIGINRMGRVRRAFLRLADQAPELEVGAVTDVADLCLLTVTHDGARTP